MNSIFKILIKVLLIALFIFPNAKISHQQISVSDSALNAISIQNDSPDKVDKLILLARKIADTSPVKARPIADLAASIADDINYRKGKLNTLYEFAYIYKILGKTDSAIIFIEKYLALSDTVNEKRNLAKGYYQYANLVRLKGETPIALTYLKKSEHFFRDIKDSTSLSAIYNSIGNCYENISFPDSAAKYYLKTIALCENSNNMKNMGSVLNNLASVYIKLNDSGNAYKYLNQSLELNTRYNNTLNIANAYSLNGEFYSKQEKLQLALENYNKAKALYQQLNYSIGINNLYINFGEIYQKQKNYPLAITNYDLALKYYRQTGYKTGTLAATKNKAAILVNQKKYDQAVLLYDSCLNLTLTLNDRESRRNIYSSLATLYSGQGNHKKAFEYLQKQINLQDSINKTKVETEIANLSLKYGLEKKQSEILSLQNRNLAQENALRKRTNQRNAYLFSGSGLILVFLLFAGYFRNKASNEKIVAQQRIKQLEDEKKLLAVRFLVEGQEEERKRIAKEMHDGIGVLLATAKMQFSSISDVNPETSIRIAKATRLLEQATSDVRKITHNMMPGLLTKFGFFDAVEDLMEQLDDAGTISAKVIIKGQPFRFQENKEIMLYRIVQEMVHNTIKHAKATAIKLEMEILPEKLNLSFIDNGQGFDVADMLQKKSIGLTSIQSRVSFLDGKIDINAASGNGTMFSIEVNLT